MRGAIWAQSPEGVIGVGGRIPWRYQGDLRRFQKVTTGAMVVMGRRTFESINKPLPGRRNVVVTSRPLDVPGIELVASIEEALALAGDADVWFIGGARIYEEALKIVDVVDVTYVPDHVDAPNAVRAPKVDWHFIGGPLLQHEQEPALKRRVFRRRRESEEDART
jgi:dihydrofolate reductase